MSLFGQKQAVNEWLDQNPMVLGGAALLFGLVFVGLGVSALMTGRAPAKRGDDLEGGSAVAMAVLWLVFGAACLAFGGYKMLAR
ncbi:MAG: hypothetical protein K2W96_12590 [Gemmataceae bacterium]|nr:hypothetical protein [Gemmataceae bacterium]